MPINDAARRTNALNPRATAQLAHRGNAPYFAYFAFPRFAGFGGGGNRMFWNGFSGAGL